ncbi:alpha/beta fold hydrolase [Terasakiella pusilla]|uniref:alpha/beta fold hydrolase n=1 Tax=Terasakiella pusilla TaxID=64973 RepID=UPI003AA7C062
MTAKLYQITGQGAPLVMLHSSMSSKKQWAGLAERVSSDFTCIAIDLIGYGAASLPTDQDGYSLQSEIDHIDQILADAGLDTSTPVHLIGHSFGGACALYWAHQNPTRVKSMHLFEPVAFHLLNHDSEGWQEIANVVSNLERYMAQGDETAACTHFINYWSGAGAFESFPPHIQQAMTTQVPKVILDFVGIRNCTLDLSDYATFDFPISLIKGSRSPIASRSVAKALQTALAQIDFSILDCGHMGPITHSQQINDIWVEKLHQQKG